MAGVAAPAGAALAGGLTTPEVDAAKLLLQLSESSATSGGSSSSLRSLNAAPAPAPGTLVLGDCVDWEEDDEHEVPGSQHRMKRYRLITEIYAATEEIGECSGSGRKNKKKE
ncbi:hypothetical protein CFC21_067097 [Triticum aestivum]|uniref:Uncharacterized protein n=2 Tax=Triticum aestivum TaxID=4565 RepID=A0A3B6KL07_WHEAT|nr:hypothetical protein CFC21_067097 [Triticum aestivum]